MIKLLSCGDVVAGLPALKLDVAATIVAQFLKGLAQGVEEHSVGGVGPFKVGHAVNLLKAVVGDVEGGAIHVAAVPDGVAVHAAQPPHVVAGAQHRGDDKLILRQALCLQLGLETGGDGVEQVAGARGEVGHRVGEAIDPEGARRLYLYQLRGDAVNAGTGAQRHDAKLLSRNNLGVVHVLEAIQCIEAGAAASHLDALHL